jgi:hypothetical protein
MVNELPGENRPVKDVYLVIEYGITADLNLAGRAM